MVKRGWRREGWVTKGREENQNKRRERKDTDEKSEPGRE